MKSRVFIFSAICFLLCTFSLGATEKERSIDKELSILKEWVAGEKVSETSLKTFGTQHCFVSVPISDKIFNRIYKKSYKVNCTIPRSKLRYIKVLHYNLKKEIRLGELICHQDIAADLLAIFKALYKAKYPIERMVLIDFYDADDEKSMQANNTTCFNFRRVAGSKKLSNHSTGHAIDINPKYNPMVKVRNGKTIVSPRTSTNYSDRSKNFPYKIDKNDLCYKEFRKRGFIWGGSWKSVKDYQHFEKPTH